MAGISGKIVALTPSDRRLFAEALLLVYAAKFLLLFRPVRRVIDYSVSRKTETRTPERALLKSIRLALNRTDRMVFWKNRCLVQSIAGRWMLQRRGIRSKITFGIARGEERGILAHAWLTAEGYEVIPKNGDYIELSAF